MSTSQSWLSSGFCLCLPQGLCVVNNFQGVHRWSVQQKAEEYRGLPLMTFPRVESPLETLSAQVHKEA